MLQQEGTGIGVELLLGQEILDQDTPDQLSGSRLVLDVRELSRDQPLDHGLRHPPCELLFSRHDPGRSGYMAVRGGVKPELSGKSGKMCA
jgi:hypothetical protein